MSNDKVDEYTHIMTMSVLAVLFIVLLILLFEFLVGLMTYISIGG